MAWYLLAVVTLLLLSAGFSGAEAALFSLSLARREELRRRANRTRRRVEQLLAQPVHLLATILVGNLVVNTTASALFTLAAISGHGMHGVWRLAAGGIVMTILLLVIGEITPKLLATRWPVAAVRWTEPIVSGAHWLLNPVVRLLGRLGAAFAALRRDPETFTAEELHTMVRLGHEQGIILESEEEILTRLIELDKRTVAEVMTPRIDIVAVDRTATVRTALAISRTAGLSRLPLFDGTLDNISGIAHVKELLTVADPNIPVSEIGRPPYFVPEVKKLPELLDELRRRDSHIAIVVDEFGQTAGLVTLEDLLETIFGEITDEYDLAEELPYSKLDDASYLVDGEIDIATLNRLFPNAFRRSGPQRLAALIHERLGRLPVAGDTLQLGQLVITVLQTAGNKLEKVLITSRQQPRPETRQNDKWD